MSESRSVKVVLIGDGAVGKTSLLTRYSSDEFNPEHEPTVFENTWLDRVIDGRRVELALWDNAGQEEFDKLRLLSYQDTDAFLVLYSINSMDAFNHVKKKWLPEIKEYCQGVPLLLIGTKCDLRGGNIEVVSAEEGQELQKDIGAAVYMECSAMTSENCSAVFEQAVREALASQDNRKALTRGKTAKAKAAPKRPGMKFCTIC
ncbi:hypothetical protein PBRA_003694 [Plasmodiophora brassicae]|nr:hypothetical protein PBRA_003694 [Plasmodiophora brassicae]